MLAWYWWCWPPGLWLAAFAPPGPHDHPEVLARRLIMWAGQIGKGPQRRLLLDAAFSLGDISRESRRG